MKLFYASLAFCVLGILFDLVSTRIALKKGFKEWNPIMAKFADPVLASGVISFAVLGGMLWAAQYEPAKATWFCGLFGVYRVVCGVVNVIRLRKG